MSDVEPNQPPPPPGWYPHDMTRQRYWDGSSWTDHFAPLPAAVVVSTGTRTNHVFHLLMTLITLGLWLPVWFIVAIANAGKR